MVNVLTVKCFVEGLVHRAPHSAIAKVGLPKLGIYSCLLQTKIAQVSEIVQLK